MNNATFDNYKKVKQDARALVEELANKAVNDITDEIDKLFEAEKYEEIPSFVGDIADALVFDCVNAAIPSCKDWQMLKGVIVEKLTKVFELRGWKKVDIKFVGSVTLTVVVTLFTDVTFFNLGPVYRGSRAAVCLPASPIPIISKPPYPHQVEIICLDKK